MKKNSYTTLIFLFLLSFQAHASSQPFQQFEGEYKLVGTPLAEDNGTSDCRIFRGFTGFVISPSSTKVGSHSLMAMYGTQGYGVTTAEFDYQDTQNSNILHYGHVEGISGFAQYMVAMLGNPSGGNFRDLYMFSGSGLKYRLTIVHEPITRRGIPLSGCYFSAELEKQ